jgi:hypothetical protein
MLTPKDYLTDLPFLPKIIMETVGALSDVVIQQNAANLISDANKQALKMTLGCENCNCTC